MLPKELLDAGIATILAMILMYVVRMIVTLFGKLFQSLTDALKSNTNAIEQLTLYIKGQDARFTALREYIEERFTDSDERMVELKALVEKLYERR